LPGSEACRIIPKYEGAVSEQNSGRPFCYSGVFLIFLFIMLTVYVTSFYFARKIAKEGGLSEWDAREDCHEDAPQRAGRLFLMHYGQASAGEACMNEDIVYILDR